MSRSGRPRLVDVAKHANVSVAVASTVLNARSPGNIRVASDTAERVRIAAAELGYLANPAAQSLARGRNHILGVFTFEPMFPLEQQNFYHPFLLGIESEAEEQAYDLLLFTSTRSDERARQRSMFRGGINRLGLADGAILFGREEERSEVEQLIRHGYPFVYVGRRQIGDAGVAYVAADYASATEDVVAQLAGLGHRSMVYLGALGAHEANIDRHAGYCRALKRLGLPSHASKRHHVQPAELDGAQVKAWLADGATAFVVEDDALARRLVTVGAELGLSVPEDVSIVLLGDPLEHTDDRTAWTMFRIPREEMGRQAVRLLVRVLEGEKDDVTMMLPCEFTEGTTMAPPRTDAALKDGSA